MKLMIKIGAVMITIAALLAYAAINFNFSKGTRSGIVGKFSSKGYLFKTWEGQLFLTGAASSGWEFTVLGGDKEFIDKIEKASRTGERVTITYGEKLFRLFWRGDTKYIVLKVEP